MQLTRSTSRMWQQQQGPGPGPTGRNEQRGCPGAAGTWGTGWWPRGEPSRLRSGWKVTLASAHPADIERNLHSRCLKLGKGCSCLLEEVVEFCWWVIYSLSMICLLSLLHPFSLYTPYIKPLPPPEVNLGYLWCQTLHILPKNFCISCLAMQGIKLNLGKQIPHLALTNKL